MRRIRRTEVFEQRIQRGTSLVEPSLHLRAKLQDTSKRGVLGGAFLRVFNHLLNLLYPQPVLVFHHKRLLLPPHLLGGYGEHSIGVHGKRHRNVHFSSFGLSYPRESKVPEQMVLGHSRAFPFVDFQQHLGLVIIYGVVLLCDTGGNGAVTWDQYIHPALVNIHPDREGGDIQQEHILCSLTLLLRGFAENRPLDGGPRSHRLIRVHRLTQHHTLKVLPQQRLNLHNPRAPPHQQHLIHLLLMYLGTFQHPLHLHETFPKQPLV
mmetsp:Transcript_29067/g.40202  ORF Transcript_29067/g.40202 Transcript_29067/m.40202 type:complete len:264 (-) Transcript_29067:362-1153(-)